MKLLGNLIWLIFGGKYCADGYDCWHSLWNSNPQIGDVFPDAI